MTSSLPLQGSRSAELPADRRVLRERTSAPETHRAEVRARMDSAVHIEGLVKRYGSCTAVDGLELDVQRGECFALLGPNGAGKTTTIEVLEGLSEPTSGYVEVLGRRWQSQPDELRARIGVALQESKLWERLTVEETLRLFRTFYPTRRGPKVESLLDEMQLTEKRGTRVMHLSGGQRQRLSLATALVGDPEILFLDEPTSGLDPQSRRALWDTLASLRERNKTIVLTTHYMDEAERLCDRVAIVDHGKRIALGSPSELIERIGGQHLVEIATSPPLASEELGGIAGVRSVRAHADGVTLSLDEPHLSLPALITRLTERAVRPTRLISRAATLDDVFLTLTGRTLREE